MHVHNPLPTPQPPDVLGGLSTGALDKICGSDIIEKYQPRTALVSLKVRGFSSGFLFMLQSRCGVQGATSGEAVRGWYSDRGVQSPLAPHQKIFPSLPMGRFFDYGCIVKLLVLYLPCFLIWWLLCPSERSGFVFNSKSYKLTAKSFSLYDF